MTINSTAQRRAATAAQTILKESTPSLIVDGKAGSFTKSVYDKTDDATKTVVDSVIRSLGFPGGMKELNSSYASDKVKAVSTSDKSAVFDMQIVPAMVRKARSIGISPVFPITQLLIESGGTHTPLKPDGSPSYNYAGIKWATVKTVERVSAATTEFISGKNVRVNADFAVFTSANDFVDAYFRYLFETSKRYPGLKDAKSANEYGAILKKGGYATDPDYASKFASMAKQASSRYALA